MADADKEWKILCALQELSLRRTPAGDRVEVGRVTEIDEAEPLPLVNWVAGESQVLRRASDIVIYEQEFFAELIHSEHQEDLTRKVLELQSAVVAAVMSKRESPRLGLNFIRDIALVSASHFIRGDGGTAPTMVRTLTWNIEYSTTERELAGE